MVGFWKISSALVTLMLSLTVVAPIAASGTASAASSNEGMSVYFFYGDGCPHCALVEPLIDSLAAKYPQVNFIKLEIWHNGANRAVYQDFNTRYRVSNPVVPEVFIADQALIAENAIKNSLESDIQRIISTNNTVSPLRYIAPATTVAIKTAHPEIKLTTPDGAVFNSSQATIAWNYTSGKSNVVTAGVAIDGGSFKSINRNATSYLASELSEGNHTFILRITDGSGSSEHSLNFTVEIASKPSSSPTSSSSFLIGFTFFILIVGVSLVFVQRTRRK